jgi:hypothetical protein
MKGALTLSRKKISSTVRTTLLSLAFKTAKKITKSLLVRGKTSIQRPKTSPKKKQFVPSDPRTGLCRPTSKDTTSFPSTTQLSFLSSKYLGKTGSPMEYTKKWQNS